MKLNQSVQKAAAILRAAAGRPDGETASGLASWLVYRTPPLSDSFTRSRTRVF